MSAVRQRRPIPLWVAACLAWIGSFTVTFGLEMDRVEIWAGDGTNRTALVVDWHDGVYAHALAWGFRWNDNATVLDMWTAVTNADHGLTGLLTNAPEGRQPAWIEYRRPAAAGDVLPDVRGDDVRWTAYSRDHAGTLFQAGLWSCWMCGENESFRPANFAQVNAGMESQWLSNMEWIVFSFSPDDAVRSPGYAMAAVYYPFAATISAYNYGIGTPPIDWIDGSSFTNSAAVLGRPTVDTTGDDWYVPVSQPMPLVPVYSAFRAFELVGIGEEGALELAFDHKVLDHPDNPYGVDFILFGNSFQVIGGGQGWTNGDPNKTSVGGSCFVERGRVFVSQDGVTWIEFTNGPYADDFVPTLGRVYDTNNVQTNLGPWNIWWGGATDPTIPVDPSMAPSNWSGYTVAELSRRYRGSAGGTAFDIGELALAQDENTGCKWIQYIKITRSGSLNPEVDAVADVSPVPPYGRWQFTHFPWMHNPVLEGDGVDADGDYIPNLLEYALGRDPTNAMPEAAFTTSWGRTNAQDYLLVHYTWATNAVDVGLAVERTDDLISPAWNTNGILQTASEPSNSLRFITSEVPAAAERGYVRMKAHHE